MVGAVTISRVEYDESIPPSVLVTVRDLRHASAVNPKGIVTHVFDRDLIEHTYQGKITENSLTDPQVRARLLDLVLRPSRAYGVGLRQ